MHWSGWLEFTTGTGLSDVIRVRPFLPHQEIGASDAELLKWVPVRGGQEAVLVELGMPTAGQSEAAFRHDPLRKEPGG